MVIRERYLLVLVCLDKNKIDIAGNQYPREGFVRAKEFTTDIDLRYGLYGNLWGKISPFSIDDEDIKNNYWAVVKTTRDDNIILINSFDNKIKFESGFVLHIGSIRSAGRFIVKIRKNRQHFFVPEVNEVKIKEIAGTKEWFELYKRNKKKLDFYLKGN